MKDLVIGDHKKISFYANGLQPERIKVQHNCVDELNDKMLFLKFKSIESDMLIGGTFDSRDDILSTFDPVIESIQSNVKMKKEKATRRLPAVITNPYTSILGHLTRRLLLFCNGYPVEHKIN